MIAAPERLLAALIARPDGVHQVPALAGDWEPARLALEARGHVLHATSAGLRLECARAHFDPAAFAAVRRGGLGTPLEIWEAAASTNDLAHAAAARGASEGAAWLAEQQTAGRGRQGRSWHSAPHAGLLVSWLLRPRLQPSARPGLLAVALGLGACEALRAATGLDVRCKWPNDLWLAGGKLAGWLVEARSVGEPYVVAGLGLNVLRPPSPPEALAVRPVSLREHGAMAGRETLLAALCAGIERRYDDWRQARFARLVEAWEGLDLLRGRTVRVQLGGEALDGCAAGITDSGLLQLDTGTGRRELAAGEVHLL